MKLFSVSYIKKGDIYESLVKANNADEAREHISTKYNIPFKFEIGVCENEYNHVSAVIELK